MIPAAHQTMLAPQGAPLPYDAEVEYIESTGTQYIDTGIVINNGLAYEITFAAVGTQSGPVLIGGRGSSNDTNQRILFYNNAIQVQRNTFTERASLPYDTETHTIYSSASEIRIDSTTYASVNASNTTDVLVYIFRQNNNNTTSSPSYSKARVSACKMWTNSTLVRDFVPVRVGSGSSAVGHLFDRVSGTLFGNAGTGAFTIGPDK